MALSVHQMIQDNWFIRNAMFPNLLDRYGKENMLQGCCAKCITDPIEPLTNKEYFEKYPPRYEIDMGAISTHLCEKHFQALIQGFIDVSKLANEISTTEKTGSTTTKEEMDELQLQLQAKFGTRNHDCSSTQVMTIFHKMRTELETFQKSAPVSTNDSKTKALEFMDVFELSQKTKDLIALQADKVRQFFDISTPVSDINAAVRKLGGTIEFDEKLSEFSDGGIRKTGEVSFCIYVSPHQSAERRNFSVAYELGHLFLQMGFMTNPEKWENQKRERFCNNPYGVEELMAREFAYAFLMPEKEYIHIMKKCSDYKTIHINKMAEYFHVPTDIIKNRGRSLGFEEL